MPGLAPTGTARTASFVGPRPEGGAPRPEGGRGRPFREDRGDSRHFERREPVRPLPDLDLSLRPEDKGVESLARQIKMTGRAYPLFDIAQMILQKPERHTVQFMVKKNPRVRRFSRLFVCALDDTLWLSEDEAVSHVLGKHFATFYQAERTATEPPKGKYTFVAQCGISGVIFGPPNHHDYQNQLRKLHAERFSRMPFEEYKSRVRIVRDQEVVKKWVDDQSWKTDYIGLNLPEPLRLREHGGGGEAFPRDAQGEHYQAGGFVHPQRRDGTLVAQPRPGPPGPQRLGGPAALPAPDCDSPEPAVCGAWLAVL